MAVAAYPRCVFAGVINSIRLSAITPRESYPTVAANGYATADITGKDAFLSSSVCVRIHIYACTRQCARSYAPASVVGDGSSRANVHVSKASLYSARNPQICSVYACDFL